MTTLFERRGIGETERLTASALGVRVRLRRTWVRIGMALAGASLALFVFAFDSFRLTSTVGELGGRATAPVLSAFYDAGRDKARDAISVVLITEESLDRYGADGLVPRYRMQGDLVQLIAARRPAAIFLDFTYVRPRENAAARAAYADTLEFVRDDMGVPVFIGPVRAHADLARFAEQDTVDVGWRIEQADQYAFAGATGELTAAARLYRELCEDPNRDCSPGFVEQLADAGGAASLDPMTVQWGAAPPRELLNYWSRASLEDCVARGNGVLRAMGRAVRAAWRGAAYALYATDYDDPLQSRCSYHLSAPASLILDPGTPNEALDNLIEGRVVMIGTAVRALRDTVEAPGHGVLPGVYQHAMALDNLLVYGAHYKRWPPILFLALDAADVISAFLIFFLFFGLDRALRYFRTRRAAEAARDVGSARSRGFWLFKRYAPIAYWFAWALLSGVIVTFFAVFVLNWSGKSVGLVTVAGLMRAVSAGGDFGRIWRQFRRGTASRDVPRP